MELRKPPRRWAIVRPMETLGTWSPWDCTLQSARVHGSRLGKNTASVGRPQRVLRVARCLGFMQDALQISFCAMIAPDAWTAI